VGNLSQSQSRIDKPDPISLRSHCHLAPSFRAHHYYHGPDCLGQTVTLVDKRPRFHTACTLHARAAQHCIHYSPILVWWCDAARMMRQPKLLLLVISPRRITTSKHLHGNGNHESHEGGCLLSSYSDILNCRWTATSYTCGVVRRPAQQDKTRDAVGMLSDWCDKSDRCSEFHATNRHQCASQPTKPESRAKTRLLADTRRMEVLGSLPHAYRQVLNCPRHALQRRAVAAGATRGLEIYKETLRSRPLGHYAETPHQNSRSKSGNDSGSAKRCSR
jgi:hypothetical protein